MYELDQKGWADFPKSSQVVGKHNCSEGEHFVWGPGHVADAAANPDLTVVIDGER